MSELMLPLLWVAAGVMLLAGLGKLRSPEPASAALATAGLPSSPIAVRLLGLGEACIGLWCIVEPARTLLAALALAYFAFAAFLLLLRRRADGPVSCGCFGEGSFQAGRGHVSLNVVGAVVAALSVIWVPPPLSAAGLGALESIALVAGVAACVGLSYHIFAALPRLWGSYGAA